MMGLLVYKEKLKNFYAEHEFYVNPIIKFISAFIALTLIKKNVGYNDLLTMWPVIMGISVIMAFMPWTIIITALTAIMCINIFTLSIELGALVVIILLIMLLLYFRFTPTQGIFVLFVPMAFFLKIPYIVPIIAGLICTPVSIVSVTFGTIVYYMIAVIGKNADAIQNVASEGTNAANLNTVLKMISVNNQLFLVIAAFIITTLVVYFIRRSSVNNAWIIAIIVGGVVDCVIILVGALILNTEYSIIEVILGSVGSILLGCIIQFFVFSVDYSRTEHTQFEDDEYYYYVKAVPKKMIAKEEKVVKHFGNTHQSEAIHFPPEDTLLLCRYLQTHRKLLPAKTGSAPAPIAGWLPSVQDFPDLTPALPSLESLCQDTMSAVKPTSHLPVLYNEKHRSQLPD